MNRIIAPRLPLHLARAAAAGLALAAAACGGPIPDGSAEPGAGLTRHAIAGGYADDKSHAVVGIANIDQGVSLCSGSLIAPNLVLTAQHCVADVRGEVGGGVSCNRTRFGSPHDAETFLVTTRPEFSRREGDYRKVVEVLTPPADDEFCGNDQAMLILETNIPETEAVPLVPRVDDPLVAGEIYSAVGYGATNDNGNGSGERRRRDSLTTDCVGEDCDPYSVTAKEWTGEEGVCQGDSGGPAIDANNRVIGIASRGGARCSSPIYGYVLGYADWIKQTAVRAAGMGGYPAPKWANGWPTDPKFDQPVGDACSDPTSASECGDGRNGRCITDIAQQFGQTYCTRQCAELAPCPDGYGCTAGADGVALCVKNPPPIEQGCAVAPGSRRAGAEGVLLVVAGIVLGALRRRRGR